MCEELKEMCPRPAVEVFLAFRGILHRSESMQLQLSLPVSPELTGQMDRLNCCF
jgi:hypothetical protein